MFFTIVKESIFKGHSHYKTIVKDQKVFASDKRNNTFHSLKTPSGWWEIK
jgi:hypothetical protein